MRQCLDSLVRQTCKDKEIILVDDGSTDSSGSICDEYAKTYDFVRVIHQENQGLSGARNTGIDQATGEWLSFVDSDDWVATDMLERLMGYIFATNADMYRFNYVRVEGDKEHNWFSRRYSCNGAIINIPDEQALFRCYYNNYKALLNAWGGVYRHSIIREHHLRFVDTREVCLEDVLFNFQYVLHTKKIVALSDTPYYYRDRENSLIHLSSVEDKLLGVASLLERAYQTTIEQGLTFFQQHFYTIYIEFMGSQLSTYASDMSDEQIREILDKVSHSNLYRKCVNEKLKEDGDEPTIARQWYRKSFGKKGRSHFAWCTYLFLKRIRYAMVSPSHTLPYILCTREHVAYAVNFKGACSSIIVSMSRKDDIRDDYSVFKRKNSHIEYCPPIRSKQWLTFTFVRNPFARLVSCYESKYHEDRARHSIAIHRGYLDYDYYLDGYIREDKGFAYFINQIMRIPYPMEDFHFCSQYHRFIGKNGKPLVNFIGRVERLKADYEPLRQKYGFDPLRRYNKVDYGDWRDYYTTKLAKKVYRKYKKDVQYFGYEQEYRDLLDYCKRKERK